MRYIDRLIKNCELAKKACPISEVELLNPINPSSLCCIDKGIYIIEEVDGNPEQTFTKFSTFKKVSERKCAKLNSPSKVLYVGSSSTGLKKRIKQHIGEGHKSTYSLNLSHWFSGKYKITVKEYDVPREVLQIIEDDLSDQLKPAFGKQGGNNK